MKLVDLSPERATAIREFEAISVAAVALASGSGAAHVYALHFEPGGLIGPHVAGFGQVLVPLTGSGWVAGADGVRFPLVPGQAAYWSRGELHSKGSGNGMTAVMIQVRDLGSDCKVTKRNLHPEPRTGSGGSRRPSSCIGPTPWCNGPHRPPLT
jgi:hypothetical protein